MPESLQVFELKQGDHIEFTTKDMPPGRQLVIVAWGVKGSKGPIAPWMVATRDDNGKVRNFTLEPAIRVLCHSRRPAPQEDSKREINL
jgi:hypothetical protein